VLRAPSRRTTEPKGLNLERGESGPRCAAQTNSARRGPIAAAGPRIVAAPISGVVGGWGLEIGAALSLKEGRERSLFYTGHDFSNVNLGNGRVTKEG